MTTTRTIRVLIADDHRAFAEAIAVLLAAKPDFVVVGVCRTAVDTELAVSATRPDVLLLDVELGSDDGIELARRLRDTVPGTAVVIVTFRDDLETVSAAVRAGVAGFLAKDATPEELVDAVRRIASGDRWIQSRLLGPLLDELADHPGSRTPTQQRLATLTERELTVLRHMVRGLDRASIARELYLSTSTVRTHTQNLLAKLGVHSSLEAVAVALKAGMRPFDEDAETGTPRSSRKG
jgi:DNA-binding NarL/FixJ family response regulator